MATRYGKYRVLQRLRNRFESVARSFERFGEFHVGPREAGIVFVAAACMLFMASAVSAARIDSASTGKDAEIVFETVERLISQARSEWRANDHAAVVDTLSAVIAIPTLSDPARAAALLDRGNAYLQLGDASRAVLDFDASLDLSSAEPERAYLLRGMAYELQGEREQAAWSYIRALREAPENQAINHHVMRFFSGR